MMTNACGKHGPKLCEALRQFSNANQIPRERLLESLGCAITLQPRATYDA